MQAPAAKSAIIRAGITAKKLVTRSEAIESFNTIFSDEKSGGLSVHHIPAVDKLAKQMSLKMAEGDECQQAYYRHLTAMLGSKLKSGPGKIVQLIEMIGNAKRKNVILLEEMKLLNENMADDLNKEQDIPETTSNKATGGLKNYLSNLCGYLSLIGDKVSEASEASKALARMLWNMFDDIFGKKSGRTIGETPKDDFHAIFDRSFKHLVFNLASLIITVSLVNRLLAANGVKRIESIRNGVALRSGRPLLQDEEKGLDSLFRKY